jgi:hypothetical protein
MELFLIRKPVFKYVFSDHPLSAKAQKYLCILLSNDVSKQEFDDFLLSYLQFDQSLPFFKVFLKCLDYILYHLLI